MKYIVRNQCTRNIVDFYRHVAMKYKPTIERWQKAGWHMANAGKWYYAYTINGETITIEDACHEQNMH